MTQPGVRCLLLMVLAGCAEKSSSGQVEPRASGSAGDTPASAAPMSSAAPPVVGLDGKSQRVDTRSTGSAARIYAKSMRTWIYDAPKPATEKLGTLRAGMSLAVSKALVGREGCASGWYAVEPQGFICAGDEATPDPNDPIVRALAEFPADLSRRLPFIYGTVRRPGPIYRRLPTPAELEQSEPDLKKRIQTWLSAPGETGAGYAQHVWIDGESAAPDPKVAWETQLSDSLPWFLADGKTPPKLAGRGVPDDDLLLGRMEPRTGFSILKTFLQNGRRYALSSDLALVPTDRLRPIQGSRFHGFRIPEDVDFPFAIVRAPGARHYRLDRKKNRLVPGDAAEYRTPIRLTGKQNFFRGRLHYETVNDTWLSDSDASRLDPARRMPAWGKNGEKWIDVNVTKQTLVLFEGPKAVFATLVSTGEAGLRDAEHSTATQRGIFRIHTKFVSATMDSDVVGEEFELRDVPYVQYFEKGYALHGAYWHDRFGIPKSHGCINLAPEDARRIFFWTEPTLPPGWYSVLKPLRGTVIFVHS